MIAIGEHNDRQQLMRERERQRRLIEQRRNAERRLRCDSDGQHDRACRAAARLPRIDGVQSASTQIA